MTREDIITLRDEAARAGDEEQVALCDRALWGNSGSADEAWALCEQAVHEAAMAAGRQEA